MEPSLQHDPPRVSYAGGQRETQERTAAQHILLPGPSMWPLLLGAAVAAFVAGLLFIDNYPWFSLITLSFVLITILGWVLEEPVARPALAPLAGSMPPVAVAPLAVVEMPTLKLGRVSITGYTATEGVEIVADIPTSKLGSISMAGPSLASGQFKWGKQVPSPSGSALTPLPALYTHTPYGQTQRAQQNIPQPTQLPQQPPAQLYVPPIQHSGQRQGYKKRGMKRGVMIGLLCSIVIVVLVLGYGLSTVLSNRNTSNPAATLTPSAQLTQVTVHNAGFSPTSITIAVGSTVTWTNKSTLPHTVTDSGVFDSGNLPVGSTYRFTFTHPGTYHYTCTYHPNMVGTIIVQ